MKKKGYYIYFKLRESQAGVRRKIDDQMAVLGRHLDISELEIKKEKVNFIKGILSRLPFGSYAMDYDSVLSDIDNPDFVYIRHKALDHRYFLFLKKIKKRNSDVKIILEIPTYPYKGEILRNKTMWPFYFKDAFRRNRLKGVIERIATFSEDDTIFGIPTIKTQNGIMVDRFPVISKEKKKDSLNLIAVASLLPYHGYERCILGLSDYYSDLHNTKKEQIYLHIVGDGDELRKYKEIVKKHKLESHVKFYGKLVGEELNAIFEDADIALGSFGMYKIDLNFSSQLKIREYLARGLPVVSACVEDVFQNANVDFYLNFANDNSNIDFNKISEFYHRLLPGDCDKKRLSERIRIFAENNVDMSIVMKPIINYILGDENEY